MATNAITPSGIEIQTLAEVLQELKNGTTDFPGMFGIYGSDINLDPNTADGQLLNLIAQGKIDILELIVQVYNSFDPDLAVGISLDRDCAYNGIHRAGGTFTQQPVDITVDRAVTLQGLDTNPTSPFTVQDISGNQYQLVSTTVHTVPGTYSLIFQAKEIGAVNSALNTITDIVTVTLGVLSCNNISAANSVGVAQESDPALRTRRARSTSIPSKGYLDGLIGSLLDLDGVTQAEVFENFTNVTDSRLIPAHSIWAIVAGGSAADIANVIYIKRSMGCGMKGDTVVNITQLDGVICPIRFDRPIVQKLWIKINVEPITGVIDTDYLRAQLLSKLSYKISESADSSHVVALAKEIYPNGSFFEEGVSVDGVNYYSLVLTDTVQHQFSVWQIDINGTIS